MKIIACGLVVVATLLPSSTLAQGAGGGPPAAEGPRYSVGLGVILPARPYAGYGGTDVFPVPIFGVRTKRFSFDTVRAEFRAVDREIFHLDVFARARFSGYDPDESPELEGMEKRRISADAGLRIAGRWEHVETELELATDALSASDGEEAVAALKLPFGGKGWRFTPAVALAWQSQDFVSYYYGVRASEAKPSRPAYDGDDAFVPRAEIGVLKRFARHWTFVGSLRHEWYPAAINDSPIVEDVRALGGFFGFTYTF